jgi:outer membrane protein TolC
LSICTYGFFGFIAFCCFSPSIVLAEARTLNDFIKMMDEDIVLESFLDNQVEVQRSIAESQIRVSGPSFSTGIRSISGLERETAFGLSQQIPLHSTLFLKRKAERLRLEAVEQKNKTVKIQRIAVLMNHFFRAIWLQERIKVLQAQKVQIQRVGTILQKKSEIGEISLMGLSQQERLERNIDIQIQREEISFLQQTKEIASLLGLTEPVDISGNLSPSDCGVSSKEIPQVRVMEYEIAALEVEQSLARKAWLPKLSVQGGWVEVEENSMKMQGWSGGVGLSFGGIGNATLKQKTAEVQSRDAERALLVRTLTQEKSSYIQTCTSLLALAEEAKRGVVETEKILVQVETGYSAGYNSLFEVVAIQDNVLSDRLSLLELWFSARKAYIQWFAISGEL